MAQNVKRRHSYHIELNHKMWHVVLYQKPYICHVNTRIVSSQRHNLRLICTTFRTTLALDCTAPLPSTPLED